MTPTPVPTPPDAPLAPVLITHAWFASVASERGGWTLQQLTLLGVAWPPMSGWKRKLVGTTIPGDVAAQVAAVRGQVLPRTLKQRANNVRRAADAVGAPPPLDARTQARLRALLDTLCDLTTDLARAGHPGMRTADVYAREARALLPSDLTERLVRREAAAG